MYTEWDTNLLEYARHLPLNSINIIYNIVHDVAGNINKSETNSTLVLCFKLEKWLLLYSRVFVRKIVVYLCSLVYDKPMKRWCVYFIGYRWNWSDTMLQRQSRRFFCALCFSIFYPCHELWNSAWNACVLREQQHAIVRNNWSRRKKCSQRPEKNLRVFSFFNLSRFSRARPRCPATTAVIGCSVGSFIQPSTSKL